MPTLPKFLQRERGNASAGTTRRILRKSEEVDSPNDEGMEEDCLSQTSGSSSSAVVSSSARRASLALKQSVEDNLDKLEAVFFNTFAMGKPETAVAADEREALLSQLKIQVKQLMEEAVTRKFIHEESSSVTSFCAAVDACLLCGLRRQIGTFFRAPTSWDLLCKLSSSSSVAQQVMQRCQELSVTMSNGSHKPIIMGSGSGRNDSIFSSSGTTTSLQRLFRDSASSSDEQNSADVSRMNYCATQSRYMWLRVALCDKYLAQIIDVLVKNANKFYCLESVVADPCHGEVLINLIAGPCALDYTKLRTHDHVWTDPPADELVQRHRLQYGGFYSPDNSNASLSSSTNGGYVVSSTSSTASVHRRPSLSTTATSVGPGLRNGNLGSGSGVPTMSPGRSFQAKPTLIIRAMHSSSSEDSRSSGPPSAKDYVEALHQNSKSVNIYGKNNVQVQVREDVPRMPGYLGLHSTQRGLLVQWIPNQLMSSCYPTSPSPCVVQRGGIKSSSSGTGPSDSDTGSHHQSGEHQSVSSSITTTTDASAFAQTAAAARRQSPFNMYWDYALTLHLEEIVYIHCHHEEGFGGVVIFVDQDGVQRPPFHFPPGSSHVSAFLTHLETALAPNGRLDPPFWSQRQKSETMFTPVKRRSTCRTNTRSLLKKEALVNRARSYDIADTSTVLNRNQINDKNTPDSKDSKDGTVSTSTTNPTTEITQEDDEELKSPTDDLPMDMVFRVIYPHRASKISSAASTITNAAGFFISTSSHIVNDEPWLDISLTGQERHGDRLCCSWASNCSSNTDSHLQNRSSIKQLCQSMRKQILARAFYGWLSHCRYMHSVRQHLSHLVLHQVLVLPPDVSDSSSTVDVDVGLTEATWLSCKDSDGRITDPMVALRLVYLGGCAHSLRKEVWPFLLGYYDWSQSKAEREQMFEEHRVIYEQSLAEWMIVETIVRDREQEEQRIARLLNICEQGDHQVEEQNGGNNESNHEVPTAASREAMTLCLPETFSHSNSKESLNSQAGSPASFGGTYSTDVQQQVAINLHRIDKDVARCDRTYEYFQKANRQLGVALSDTANSIGSGTGNGNLDKLRNVMCTYVWDHLTDGYVQGMCDLLAPLLVILDDEVMAHACFQKLMQQMRQNFPGLPETTTTTTNGGQSNSESNGGGGEVLDSTLMSGGNTMDQYFANMRSLIQILDPALLEHMQRNGDYTHFYFCYRWFLLNFKRELKYEDVFWVWETIWSAEKVATKQLNLFVAVAMILYYRDIIIDNDMDFTDIIRFFNEIAEKHNTNHILTESRQLVHQLQILLLNK